MSIADFGSSVEEVRQKLSEILPLVDAGQQQVEELHDQLGNELSDVEQQYTQLADTLKKLDELADGGQDGLEEVKTGLDEVIEELAEGLEDFEQRIEDLSDDLQSAKQQIDQVLSDAEQVVQQVGETIAAEFESMFQGVDRLQDAVGQLDGVYQQDIVRLMQGLTDFGSQFQSDAEVAEEMVSSFTEAATEFASGMGETFTTLEGMVSDTAFRFVDTLTAHHGELGEFFTMFGSDSQNLTDEFQAQVTEIFSNLKAFVEDEVAEALSESVENTLRAGVEAIAAEVLSSIATTQVGVATTSALSPVLPEIVAAQKLTDLINSVL